jgi:hypothetical protein
VDVDQEFEAFCPSRGATTLRKDVIQAASPERNAIEGILKENRFTAMTINGGQVGALGRIIKNLVTDH